MHARIPALGEPRRELGDVGARARDLERRLRGLREGPPDLPVALLGLQRLALARGLRARPRSSRRSPARATPCGRRARRPARRARRSRRHVRPSRASPPPLATANAERRHRHRLRPRGARARRATRGASGRETARGDATRDSPLGGAPSLPGWSVRVEAGRVGQRPRRELGRCLLPRARTRDRPRPGRGTRHPPRRARRAQRALPAPAAAPVRPETHPAAAVEAA